MSQKAPDFKLHDQNNDIQSLDEYKGQWLVIYFYPKDDTPGCTKEACSFRDNMDKITDKGIKVIGISKDSVKSHKKFADKHDLNFSILSDESTDTIKAYDAWGEKSMFGKKYNGVIRKTFIIDPDGNIVKEYPKVSPKNHAEQILKDIESLQNE